MEAGQKLASELNQIRAKYVTNPRMFTSVKSKLYTHSGYSAAKSVQTDVTVWKSQTATFRAAIDFSPMSTSDIVITCAGLEAR